MNTMDTEQRNDNFVLAIDPALSTTGYAVIDFDTEELVCINKFTTSSKIPQDERMNNIVTQLFQVARQYSTNYIILEDGFLGVNAKTSLQLATLRGAVIGTFNFNERQVKHMLPSLIRKHFGCVGNAKKEQVAAKVTELYGHDEKLIAIGPYSDKQNKNKTSDIYDAISIGVAFIRFTKESMKDGLINE